MRRLLTALLAIAVSGAWLASSAPGDGGPDGDYVVRAFFNNAGFLVKGEEVRVSGAKIGTIEEVDVARPSEPAHEDGRDEPGAAVVVFRVEDPGFQDFRADASCLIRPQSLLGEKYVDCEPTQPRASGSEPPPPLTEIGDGEPGEGQLFLPLENNGKAVDLDLVNNITREPEIDRFRLILNDLGAGLAARGDDLREALESANPALRETDELLAILAEQNRGLAQLAADSDTILEPLARERRSVAGFIRNANQAGQAAAERRDDIEAGFAEFPAALTELETTMVELRRFAEAGTPLARDLKVAAPPFTEATEALGPFSKAANTAVTSLGEAAEDSEDDLVESRPVIRQLRTMAEASEGGAKALEALFGSLRKTGGIDELMGFVLNGSNAFNGYDEFGHFLRATLLVTNCVEVVLAPLSGCGSNWAAGSTLAAANAPAPAPGAEALRKPQAERPEREQRGPARASSSAPEQAEPSPEQPEQAADDSGPEPPAEDPAGDDDQAGSDDEDLSAERRRDRRSSKQLMEYLMGDGR